MPHSKNLYYQFGPYQFDLCNRILARNGETIPLTHKATEILVMLIRNAGQLVEKDELLTKVWADTFVEEGNLTQNIFTLRKALGHDPCGPKYIETVARRGYRFVGPVRVVDSPESRNGNAPLLEPVVAVLPFLNSTGDRELEYLAEGLTNNITNNLSRVSKLRVMSRSAVFRYHGREIDPRVSGREMGANVVLVGKISARSSGLTISVELVDVSTGWQLWGESFDSENKDLLQIQDVITKQLLATLKLKLTGEEERQVTARYTDNADAYQSYLEGRYHWSRYTKKGIEKAILHFRRAIELDPNYALAYAAIVDCYLRLATNYLPPEQDVPRSPSAAAYLAEVGSGQSDESDPRVKLRFEWDWKGAERELRRANDLKTDYPAAHQWYFAYRFSVDLFQSQLGEDEFPADVLSDIQPTQLYFGTLTPNEEIQILCTVAREQIEVGNYDAGCLVLKEHWTPGEWPKLDGMNSRSAADLLFTTGCLAGCLSSTGRIQKGQKQAEALLSGAIAIFEHLTARRPVAEAKIELALCYYRQGMFEPARKMLVRLIDELQAGDNDLRSLAFVRLAVVERHAGHITDSLARLSAASSIAEQSGPLITGRYHHELAIALKDAAIAEGRSDYSEIVQSYFSRARHEFEAIGHLRYIAVIENNHGLLLLDLQHYHDAEVHLLQAQKLFRQLEDKIRRAQVDDCLGRLYMVTDRYDKAEFAIDSAIASLEADDEEALLAEALTTKGQLFCKQNRDSEARQILEWAWRIAERCGDNEGAGRALLILIEEMHHKMGHGELDRLLGRARKLLEHTQQAATRARLTNCLNTITRASQDPRP